MQNTSEKTSLGYVLQLLVELALKEANIKFVPNYKYHSSFIKPDVLIPSDPPSQSVHVTATGGDDSFRMKRWRYVDEILQMRSVWKNTFVAINVMFGPLNVYQARDRELLKNLFDYEISVHGLINGEITYQNAIQAVKQYGKVKTSSQIVKILAEQDKTISTIQSLAGELKIAISTAKVTNAPFDNLNELSDYLQTRKTLLSKMDLSEYQEAFWKRSILFFLATTPLLWGEAINIKDKSVLEKTLTPRLVTEGLRAKLLKKYSGIASKITLKPDVQKTLEAGLTKEFLDEVRKDVENNPRRKYELEDLWDTGIRASKAIKEVRRAIYKGKESINKLVLYSITNGGSKEIDHHRSHVIDVLISAVGWSQNYLQEKYSGPSIGVTDPIRNIIPRTEIAQQALKKSQALIPSITSGIVDAIWDELEKVDWNNEDELIQKYLNYRVYCLIKGSSIDPLKDFICDSIIQEGWTICSPNISCSHPLIGITKTQFTGVASKGEKRLLVKCLFGDTGSDHKAEEMEARMRIIRTCPNLWKNSITVFVTDGKWSTDHRQALFLGGWDHLVAVNQFKTLLQTI
jgi:hypothetical protein